jgi:UDPglucose--hexose-1-phosphate uridylyltransferase
MELRKDPITRSWVVAGGPDEAKIAQDPCPLCPGNSRDVHSLLYFPSERDWEVRAIPHPQPLYRIEGAPGRAADGIYDRMAPIGAHEVIVESSSHTRKLRDMTDAQIRAVLDAYTVRIADLKRDPRFKYVTVFKNQGALAGEEWPHAHSQVTATTFVPRRILYELRAAREYFRDKDRCVFCDILRQEEKQKKRIVESIGDYVAFCPYASRVPFEVWIMPRRHNHQFETLNSSENRFDLAALLGRTLRRLGKVCEGYHMVVHTAPNTAQTKGELSEYWKTIAGDYHWHIEILPIVESRSKSYSIKEIYFNARLPEDTAEQLRSSDPGTGSAQ